MQVDHHDIANLPCLMDLIDMLELLQAYTGHPISGLQFLILPRETLLLYPLTDSVVILNARTLTFLRALAFWEAFPGTRHGGDFVKCLSIDHGMKLVVASMGARVAAWSLSGVRTDSWHLHSSLLLPEDQQVTALDCESGLLAVGTRSSLSVYTLMLENDLPTWSKKWTYPVALPARVRFSPSLMYICTVHDNTVRIYSTTSGRQTQAIPHPRPVTDITWRRPQASSRDDPILYTTTTDGTLRVFLPVLDAPQHVQLHAALDASSALPLSSSLPSSACTSSIFPLDRDVVLAVLRNPDSRSAEDDARSRRVREIAEEEWDLFLRVLSDGSLVIQAVANIDRRPPTLLRQFTLLQSPPSVLPRPPSHVYVLPNPASPGMLTLVTSPPLAAYALSPLPFFDAREDGLKLLATNVEESMDERDDGGYDKRRREIVGFVRTPDGEGVAALYADGGGETWSVKTGGRDLVRTGGWKVDDSGDGRVDRVVILDRGHTFVTYSSSSNLLTLHTMPPATLHVPLLVSLFALPLPSVTSSSRTLPAVVGITDSHVIILINLTLSPPSMSIHSETRLPLTAPPKMMIPVDPMAWCRSYSGTGSAELHDVLLSMSDEGELAFWVPEQADLFTGNIVRKVNGINGSGSRVKGNGWRCTGRVRTGRSGLSKAACSSAKKSVLIVPSPDGEELTIWDSKASEFSSGLEYREVLSLSDPINDLDWSATPDTQSILAIGFAHRVEVLCQQRMTYFDETPGWGRCWTIHMASVMSHPISDSIWLARGSLLIGAEYFMCLYGQPDPGSNSNAMEEQESLFEHVARHNGPLDEYHPQMILQCLLWEKVEVVKKVIVNLARNLESEKNIHEWQGVPVEEFLRKDETPQTTYAPHRSQYPALFSVSEDKDESDDDQFSRSLVLRLIERLEEQPLQHLTPNELASLLVLIQTTLEIQEQRRALDANGLRFLISMRVFYILNRRLSAPSSPASNKSGAVSVRIRPRERLRFRDMVWAFHSESQELLLSQSVAACGGKMSWPDARSLGVFIWLHSGGSMRSHMEVIARNQYMSGDNRDPTACSLFYFALGKVKLVHGLWRQAAWHREQALMLKFLGNDFTQPRWRTAALKNAFALLSKRRFEYAAAFFLLGGSLKDAANVCIKNLSDFQLAIALARVVEEGDDGPVLKNILSHTVLPLAFKEGNRWLASWAFWLLHRRDLAVRIIVTPLRDIAAVLDARMAEIGDPHYDDPSLAILFSQLKSKSLQTAKGTSEISGRTEFNFVLQIARVFSRMGCHILALDLVRTWSFQRPFIPAYSHQSLVERPPSPLSTRFALEPALRRSSSIFIDMDPIPVPSMRSASPISQPRNGEESEKDDLVSRKIELGGLMKTAKQAVQVPEFDMNAFF
ncbi:hypothetical protein AcW1_000718 [Taiwanofungus camphoratus]|nr:hypothetical protein AcW1_000718 [Antrodia cinnamomea]